MTEAMGHECPPTPPMPDPAEMLAEIQQSNVELGIFVHLNDAEDRTRQRVLDRLTESHSALAARLGEHSGRAVTMLLGILQLTVAREDPEIMTDAGRIQPIAAHLWKTVGTLMQIEQDPVRTALGQPTLTPGGTRVTRKTTPAASQARIDSPPTIKSSGQGRSTRQPLPRRALPAYQGLKIKNKEHPLDEDPEVLLNAIRERTKTIGLGARRETDNALIMKLRDEILARGQHTEISAHGLAIQFVTTYSRLLSTPKLEAPLQANNKRLILHLDYYLKEVENLGAVGITTAYRRALTHSAAQVDALQRHWVGAMGITRADFNSAINSNVRDVTPALERIHARKKRRSAGIETAVNPLEVAPEALFAAIRILRLDGSIILQSSVVKALEPQVTQLSAELVAAGQVPAHARRVAHTFMKVLSRYTRITTGVAHHSRMTLDALRPHLSHYLNEVAQLQQIRVPNSHSRVFAYSADTITGLYDYWVATKHMPSWAFDGVLASSVINVDAAMNKLYERYGENVPPLRHLLPEAHLQAPLTNDGENDTLTLGDLLGDPSISVQPEARLVAFEDRLANIRHLSELLQTVSYDEALATVLVFDLDVRGGSDIDVASLASRLGVPVAGLARFVESTVLPQLASNAAENA